MSEPTTICILHVGDNVDLARLVQQSLNRASYRVELARDSAECLAMCEAETAHVAVVAVGLPDHAGLDLVRILTSRAPHLPIVAIVDSGNEEIALEAIELGASDCLIHDVEQVFSELLPTVIRHILRWYHLIREREQALLAQKQLFENLVTVARVTTERPALEQTLQNALDVAASLTGAEIGSLFLLDQDGDITHHIISHGQVEPLDWTGRVRLVMDEGLAGWVANQRQPALIDDLLQDDRWLSMQNGPYEARSALVVPILSAEHLVGILTLTHSSPGHFDDQDLELMQSAASQIALALRNAQMYDVQRRQAEQQTILYEILRTVGEQLDPTTVAHVAVETVVQLTGWPGVQVSLPNEALTHLTIEATAGPVSVNRGATIGIHQGIIGRAFRTAQTQYVPDTSVDPDYVVGQAATRSELAIPLRRGERVLGVLNLESDQLDAFDADDVWMAASVTEALALAMDNARLYTLVQRELAERKQAERQLRLQSAALEAAANAIVITDRDGTIVWANPATTHLTGYSVEEAIGQNPRVLKSDQHSLEFYQQLWETILSGQVWHGELINRRKDGSLYPEEMTITPVRDAQGEISHFIAIKQDITERKQAQEELQRAKDAAESSSRAKSTFLANMSHELRTPLNAIIGYSEILQEEFQDLGQTKFVPDLEKIRSAGLRLLSIINDLLDLSKVEAGKMTLILESFDLSILVDNVATAVQPQVQRNTNTLAVHCPGELGHMHADQAKVHQILLNLLDNAAKFTEQGSIRLSVTREAGADSHAWIRFEIQDSGIGMSPEQVGRLFQPFTQADPSTTRRYEGTGLGLSLTQHLCQIMGGRITVESEVDQGSTFTVHLPLHVSATSQVELPTAPVEPVESTVRAGGACTVLIIDDDPSARDMIGRYLAREGMSIRTAADGPKGLRLARERRPDVIILDICMPVMDGWDVLAVLKADARLADVPVIMVTIEDNRNKGFALGASDYLTKPIDWERLLQVVQRYGRPAGRILIIEDSDATRELLRRILERDGWSVVDAANGQVGLLRVAEDRPDLILLDLMMPEMDGFEFVAELHRNPDWRSIPVVVVTAKDLTPEDRERLNGCVDRIMEKGEYSLSELLGEIRDQVVAHTRRAELSTLLPLNNSG